MNKALINLILAATLLTATYFILKSASPDILTRLHLPDTSTQSSSQQEEAKEPDPSPSAPPVKKELLKSKAVDGKGIITPGVSQEMLTSSYWTNLLQEEAAPVMSLNEVTNFNGDIMRKISVVYDLSDYKDSLSKEELTGYIKYYKIPDRTMYDYNGKAITKAFYDSISENTNIAGIKASNTVKYGITIKKTSVRSFPTESGVYNTSTNKTLDRFQETGCEPCEPVVILHESKDKNWYFVQIYNYRGWMKKDSLAVAATKDDVFSYTNHNEFLMVTGKKIKAAAANDKSDAALEFSMGTKLFLVKTIKNGSDVSYYEIKLPVSTKDGSLEFITARIQSDEDVSVGYLPYTRYNIITQAFKLQGTPYDWGDKYSGRDCSSFLMYVFRTFGINLPRNTDEQEACGSNTVKFNNQDTLQTRLKTMDILEPGTVLYMPGHTMLYLGKANGQHYMLHAFLGYNAKEGSSSKYFTVNQVAVTSVQIQNSENTPFIMKFTSALKLQY